MWVWENFLNLFIFLRSFIKYINIQLNSSCWAFGAISALESYYARKTGSAAISLSEQQVNSCNRPPANYGCDGGDHYAGLGRLF